MKLYITVPNKKHVLKTGLPVLLAPKGKSWHENCLRDFKKKRGVYVIHHRGQIKYVGKTAGKSMSFGMRLRRHFQEKAAGKHTYPRLKKLIVPPEIKVSFFPIEDIRKMISPPGGNDEQLIALLEAVLIKECDPDFQKKKAGEGSAPFDS